jgi:hypothetical protein
MQSRLKSLRRQSADGVCIPYNTAGKSHCSKIGSIAQRLI